MIKETFVMERNDFTAKIVDGTTKALRTQTIKENGLRLFNPEKKIFALSAAIGDISEDELLEKANAILPLGLEYDYELESQKTGLFIKKQNIPENLDAVRETSELFIKDLSKISDKIVYNGNVSSSIKKLFLKNSLDLDLSMERYSFSASLMMKLRGSGNILDAFTALETFNLNDKNYQQFLKDTELIVKVCTSDVVPLKNMKYKVLFNSSIILNKFRSDIIGSAYEQKSSLLSGKLYEKIFDERINISEVYDDDELVCFVPFDHEGMVRESQLPIVEKGVLKSIVFDKKQAKKYNKISTGNGFRSYNSNPSTALRSIRLHGDLKLSSELINYDTVVFPIVSSGGDFLPNGNYSFPVQLALVFKNGKLLGKAPQLSLTGNYLDTLNKDFVSLAKADIMPSLVNPVNIMAYADITAN